jgi:hypothetical protein
VQTRYNGLLAPSAVIKLIVIENLAVVAAGRLFVLEIIVISI